MKFHFVLNIAMMDAKIMWTPNCLQKVSFRVTSEPEMLLLAQLCFFSHTVRFPKPFTLKSLLAENWCSRNVQKAAQIILLCILGLIHKEIITFLLKKIWLNSISYDIWLNRLCKVLFSYPEILFVWSHFKALGRARGNGFKLTKRYI